MADQLRIVQSTEVLVGLHGAGLDHIMFMPEGEGAMVEIQPAEQSTTQHQAGYRNLAAMLGRKYLLAEAEIVPLGQVGSVRADVEQGPGGGRLKEVELELVTQVGPAIEALVVPKGA